MNNNFKKTAIILVFCFFILAGCQLLSNVTQPLQQTTDYMSGAVQLEQKKQTDKSLAIVKCQELCQMEFASDKVDFEAGQCLREEIIPDWSCDIAHSPRQTVDDDPVNQCVYFRTGQTHHFVELDGNCSKIKVY
jgi:hypothetical protein